MNFKKGFTLIELLVVIAIIAILAAILFPVFAQAREKARASSCLSNVKQLGTATQLYLDDYEETYMPSVLYKDCSNWGSEYDNYPCKKFVTSGYNHAGNHYFTWMDSIFPYVKNTNMFTCPSAKKNRASYGMNENIHNSTKNNNFSVDAQSWADSHNNGTVNYSCTAMSQIPQTSRLVLFADTYIVGPDYSASGYDYWIVWPWFMDYTVTKRGNGGVVIDKHNGGANFCFADGHAKYYKGNMDGGSRGSGTCSEPSNKDDSPLHKWFNRGTNYDRTTGGWWNPFDGYLN